MDRERLRALSRVALLGLAERQATGVIGVRSGRPALTRAIAVLPTWAGRRHPWRDRRWRDDPWSVRLAAPAERQTDARDKQKHRLMRGSGQLPIIRTSCSDY